MSHRLHALILTAVVAVALLPAAAGAQEADPEVLCAGLPANVVGDTDGDGVITGTSEADVIVGTRGDDVILGLEGDDVICALNGADEVFAGDGNDVVYARAGDDYVDGGDGDDRLLGGWGHDLLVGGSGDDEVFGYLGRDDLQGGSGDDLVVGGPDDDYLRGQRGADTLRGGSGHDRIRSGVGDDFLGGGVGSDACAGGGRRRGCEIRGIGPRDVEEWRTLVAPRFDPLGQTDNALVIIDCESNGDPFLVNPSSNASGLFQFIESTWDWVAQSTGSPAFYEGRFDPEWQAVNAVWLVQQSTDTDHPGGPWGHWSCRSWLPEEPPEQPPAE